MPGHCATPGSGALDVVEVGGRCTRVGRLTSPLLPARSSRCRPWCPCVRWSAPERARTRPPAGRSGLTPRRRAEDRGARAVRRAGIFQARDERQLTEVVEALLAEGEADDPRAVQLVTARDHAVLDGAGADEDAGGQKVVKGRAEGDVALVVQGRRPEAEGAERAGRVGDRALGGTVVSDDGGDELPRLVEEGGLERRGCAVVDHRD